MPKDPTVLLSRPRDQSARFRAVLGDVPTIVSPVIEIRPVPAEVDTGPYELLLFASQNAVQALNGTDLQGRKALAVGETTARAAREAGLDAREAGGDSAALVELTVALAPKGRILFVRGRHSRGDVVNKLSARGFSVDSVVVYDQIEKPLSKEARKLLQGNGRVIIPLFSPRSSALMGGQVRDAEASAPFVLVALSDAVAQAWDGPEPLATHVACHPDADAMAKLIRARFRMWP